jgi:phage terminase large subunit-like protein
MILMVPNDIVPYPTLGPQVCDFIEQNMVFGPGDLRGQPVVLDDEWRGLIYRIYEVYPKGHEHEGRRRFKRVGLSLPKGLAKTERAAMIAACELHPDAPVRCTGFTKKGEPIGGPVTDPYIPLVAYTEEQSDELCYSALRIILENSPLRDDFDIGLDRILRKKGDGKAVSLSSNPNARDGARTTFSVLDETHRWTLPRQRQAHTVMQTNIPKRKIADGWMLEVTTAPEPGAGSVAEGTMDYARAVEDGRAADSSLFFFHRQASDGHDLLTREGRRAAIIEASGAAASWRDIDGIERLWDDPGADVAYLERVYCNRLVKGATQAFNVMLWQQLKKPHPVKVGALITVGFDGAQFHDATALVCTEVESGYQWLEKLWERPSNLKPEAEWQVPALEVDAAVRNLFDQYLVWRMYADPPYWQSWIAKWVGEFGEERVIEWFTNRRRQMAAALEGFHTAIKEGQLSHDGSSAYTRHIGNARRKDLPERDEQGKPFWLIQKERPDSPHKMDAAMAGVLSWTARTDAVASGLLSDTPVPADEAVFVV